MASLKHNHVLKILLRITIKTNGFLIIALLCKYNGYYEMLYLKRWLIGPDLQEKGQKYDTYILVTYSHINLWIFCWYLNVFYIFYVCRILCVNVVDILRLFKKSFLWMVDFCLTCLTGIIKKTNVQDDPIFYILIYNFQNHTQIDFKIKDRISTTHYSLHQKHILTSNQQATEQSSPNI